MKLKDWIEEQDPEASIVGVILNGPDLPYPMALRYITPGLAWFQPISTCPEGKITFVHFDPALPPLDALGDYEVIDP